MCFGLQGDQYVYVIKQGQVDEGDVDVKHEDGFGPYEVDLLSLYKMCTF